MEDVVSRSAQRGSQQTGETLLVELDVQSAVGLGDHEAWTELIGIARREEVRRALHAPPLTFLVLRPHSGVASGHRQLKRSSDVGHDRRQPDIGTCIEQAPAELHGDRFAGASVMLISERRQLQRTERRARVVLGIDARNEVVATRLLAVGY